MSEAAGSSHGCPTTSTTGSMNKGRLCTALLIARHRLVCEEALPINVNLIAGALPTSLTRVCSP
jgi:hypothetical protein